MVKGKKKKIQSPECCRGWGMGCHPPLPGLSLFRVALALLGWMNDDLEALQERGN